jgi:hypothetical protein
VDVGVNAALKVHVRADIEELAELVGIEEKHIAVAIAIATP